MTRRRSAPAWASGSRARASTPGWLSTAARQRVIRLTVTAMRPPSSGWCVPLLAHLHRSLKDGQVRHDCKPVARLARRAPDASCASRTARRSAAAQSRLFPPHHCYSASLLRVTPSDEATVRKPTTTARSRSEMRANARRKRCRGLSTIDVLAGSGLTLMTMGTVFAFSQAQLKALATQSSYAQSQNVTRTAIDLMTRELRMASLDPTNLALPVSTTLTCPGVKQGIVEATPARIHFRQDLNADGALTGPGEDVTYDLSEGQIRRTDGAAPPLAIVDSVPAGGPAFRYSDGTTPPAMLVPPGRPSAPHADAVAKRRLTVTPTGPTSNPRTPPP